MHKQLPCLHLMSFPLQYNSPVFPRMKFQPLQEGISLCLSENLTVCPRLLPLLYSLPPFKQSLQQLSSLIMMILMTLVTPYVVLFPLAASLYWPSCFLLSCWQDLLAWRTPLQSFLHSSSKILLILCVGGQNTPKFHSAITSIAFRLHFKSTYFKHHMYICHAVKSLGWSLNIPLGSLLIPWPLYIFF